ncbi:SPOR domain-containing protein [Labilibaculum sp. DW002]|uniref:SPOR domain-containing protein n=1 Tax=Paralabilibaculum antarcticum TaxID=2912572 RepID=A0ABT5VV10_9BACT|nr:SPOR domain-containing protein [Labilibaculum sp. DW002]MDE5419260.1 SPOR domain-containing protein [Labilibaculum sp. DW002]
MLDVSKYIKDLLFIHDCVILPGFGGFVANYKPADIDEEMNLGIPPSKSIGFNRNLSQNDGLLINRLSEAENLTYSEAEKSIQFFIEDLRVRIQRGEKVILDKIGCFYNDRRHNLLFEPSKELNYLVDAFGMERFSLPTLSPISDEKNHPVAIPQVKVRTLFTKKRLWYAAAAIPFILTVALLPMNSERNGSEASMISINEKKEITEKFVQLDPVVSPPEDLVAFEPKLTKKSKLEKTQKGRFYLISGSFTSIENAEILRQELISKSYPAVIIENKNLYSVAVNQFTNRAAADQFKKKVIAKNSKAFCWVLQK